MNANYMTSDVAAILRSIRETGDWSMFSLAADALEDSGADAETVESFRNGTCEEKLEIAVARYIELTDAISAKHFADHGFQWKPTTHEAEWSPKWVKIVSIDGSSRSAHSFIARSDFSNKTLGRITRGDIHKSASWKAPAKHARGSVFSDNISKSLTEYGPVYLR